MKSLSKVETGFTLKQFELGPMQNFCYLIGDQKTKKALILDPAWEPDKILTEVEENQWELVGLVASHAHYDHVNAVRELLQQRDLPVYINKEELAPAKSGMEIFVDVGEAARPVWDEEELKLGETTLRFLHTPGHSPGSQCLLVGGILLTGDTLFIGGCGRYDIPGGDEEALQNSLKRIAQLPGSLTIYPGHNYGAAPYRKLEQEKKDNPFLKEEI